jgi:hypothetical protein
MIRDNQRQSEMIRDDQRWLEMKKFDACQDFLRRTQTYQCISQKPLRAWTNRREMGIDGVLHEL